MSRAYKALVVWVVVAMGVWGCAQGQATNQAQTERVKTLESKCSKLENDYRAVAEIRDTLKKKISSLEGEKKNLQEEKNTLQEERNSLQAEGNQLRKEVEHQALVTKERDDLRGQLEQFRKGLRNLLGQAESALSTTSQNEITPPG